MDLSSLTNLAALTSGGGTAAPSADAGNALSSLLNNDAQRQALLRALAATAMGPAPPAAQEQPPAGALRALAATNTSAAAPVPSATQSTAVATTNSTNNGSNNNSAENALLLFLQAQQQQQQQQAPPPPPAAPQLTDLQNLARLRGAQGLEGLLATLQQPVAAPAPPPPPPPQPQLGNYDLMQLRAAITANPARNGAELLEQARLLSAIQSHQQALASVGEAERRLALLLGGRTAAGAAAAPTTSANSALLQAEALVQAATAVSAAAAGGPTAPKDAPPMVAQPPAAIASAPAAPAQNEGDSKMAFLGQMEMGETPKCSPCLPPVEEGNTPHYSQRVIVPLGMEEDANWLSERQCFIRSELLEVVRASHEEVLVRSSSKSIAYQQVGIRCRYCAHLQAGSRAIRASAFPSSIRQMYQSFTMMVRDHFSNCVGVPPDKKQRFLKLKGLTSPSSSLSRQYWTFAAKKLGMRDSEYGIMINEETQAEASKIPPFGTSAEETAAIQAAKVEVMVEDRDQNSVSPYLFFLMSQAQIVKLLPSERVGKRKDAAVGLPGFGCTHCAKAGRLGFCRMFPLNKRSLPDKVNDLYNHMVRCPMCPRMTQRLIEGRRTEQETNRIFAERDRDFIDRIWVKLGRDQDEAFKKN